MTFHSIHAKKMLPWVISGLFITLTGCAVSPFDVNSAREKGLDDSASLTRKQAAQQRQEPAFQKINGNYLGDSPIELPSTAKLPPIFFEKISIRSKGNSYGTVAQAARNLYLATGIPTRVTADVEMPVPGMKSMSGAAALGMTPSAPSAPQNMPPAPLGMNSPLPNAMQPQPTAGITPTQSAHVVRLDFQGTTLNYIKLIEESGGVEADYRDGAVVFSRIITKTFHLSNVNPGDMTVSDSMTKGGNAQTGQNSGTSGGSQTGSFSTNSSVGMEGKYSIWEPLKAAIDSTVTVAGKYAINQASATVTITDTKDAVNRVRKIVEQENATMGQQVTVDVRTIRISLNDNSQAGINLNAVYTILNSAGGSVATFASAAPATTTTAAAGTMTFAVTSDTNRWFNSNAALQALNQFGTIVSDSTASVTTTNRVPAMTGAYNTQGFLAQTQPASGGAVQGGMGVPGLTPGSVTTGSFLRVLPTVRANNTIMLNMSVDTSILMGFGSASTGQGQTLQQIQWANTDGTKTTSNMAVNQGEAMVMVGIGSDGVTSTANNGLGGASANATKNKNLFIVVVTPRIMKGL